MAEGEETPKQGQSPESQAIPEGQDVNQTAKSNGNMESLSATQNEAEARSKPQDGITSLKETSVVDKSPFEPPVGASTPTTIETPTVGTEDVEMGSTTTIVIPDNADVKPIVQPPAEIESLLNLDSSGAKNGSEGDSTDQPLPSIETPTAVQPEGLENCQALNDTSTNTTLPTSTQAPNLVENEAVDDDVQFIMEILESSQKDTTTSKTANNRKTKHDVFLAENAPKPLQAKKRKHRASSMPSEADTPLHLIPFNEIDDEGRDAQSQYVRLAEGYYQEKASGSISERAEIEFLQCRRKELERRAKVEEMKQDMDYEADESLFVPADRNSSDNEGQETEIEYIGVQGNKKKRPKKSLRDSIDSTLESLEEQERRTEHLEALRAKRNTDPKRGGSRKPNNTKAKKGNIQPTTVETLMHTSDLFSESRETRKEGKDVTSFGNGKVKISGDKKNALREIISSLGESEKEIAELDRPAIHKASTDFRGVGLCKITDAGWVVKGLKTPLKHFQMMGTAWMIRRETHKSSSESHSGFLADEMGLGKTIMTLALIMNDIAAGLRQKIKAKPKPTLIICPASLVFNWESEIAKHCDTDMLRKVGGVYRWTSQTSLMSMMSEELLQSSSIVITTANQVQISCRKLNIPADLQTKEEKVNWIEENRAAYRGPLFKVEWHRIIVDEATIIKNHASHTTIAIRELIARNRFALSGTPLMNTALTELYSYFKFLRIPATGDFKTFRHNFNLETSTGQNRMSAILKKYMLRRTYDDKMLGEKLVILPKATSYIAWGTMNYIERKVYNIVRTRMIEQIKTFKDGNRLQVSHILVRMLRMRQCSGHILLVLDLAKNALVAQDIAELERFCHYLASTRSQEAREDELRDLRKLLKGWHEKQADNNEHSPVLGMDDLEELGGLAQNASLHGLSYQFYKYLDDLKEASGAQEAVAAKNCGVCNEILPERPMVTSCNHLFCPGCMEDMQVNAAIAGEDKATCPLCVKQFEWCEELISREEAFDQNNSSDSGKKKKSETEAKRMKWLLDEDPLPSAKTTVVTSQIANWLQEDPNCKIIVFSQFIGFLYIMTNILKKIGMHAIRFEGSMSIEDRKDAVEEFRDHEGPCILLSSLRCGGMGLNLTMASKVINTDPWWNEALERQAFGRAYRIGQEKETVFARVFLRNTIDEKILKMQEEKAIIIKSIMEAKQKLSVEELMQLFGNNDNNDPLFVLGENLPESQIILEDEVYVRWQT